MTEPIAPTESISIATSAVLFSVLRTLLAKGVLSQAEIGSAVNDALASISFRPQSSEGDIARQLIRDLGSRLAKD